MPYSNIDKPSKYFDTKLYTGNGSTQSITGLEFSPDFTWLKHRNNATAYSHQLYDTVRGATNYLLSNTTAAENDGGSPLTTGLTSFNSDGFSLGSSAGINASGVNHVSWNWRGSDSSAVSNTSGTISSTVSANTTSGFSIVSWTGNGSNSDQTLGTGLSTPLDFVIAKPRDTGGGTDHWLIYSSAITMTQNQCLLFTSDALITGAAQGTPTRGSTAGQLKLLAGTSGNQNLNANGLKYIAYCFHNVKGFSKFGSYTGNGSTDGTFIYTGFSPAFVMVKSTSASGTWCMFDNKRSSFNEADEIINAEDSVAEFVATGIDFTSNGFKHRNSNTNRNASGVTYIYMCFASNPFVSSKGIACTAR